MKKSILLSIFCLFTTAIVFAQVTSLTISDPDRWAKTTQGIIEEPVIEITPEGIYARVDLTFTIAAQQSQYKTTDTLEAVLQFNLPDGSFIHDSWLWLDDIHIIRADVVEKNRAIAIYEGIVNRRRDPSLLIKTGASSYKLNVFPLTINYPRKVKISYSVPFNWSGKQCKIPLPTDIISISVNPTQVSVIVGQNPLFNTPSLLEGNYSSYYKASIGPKDSLVIPANDFKYAGMNLMYQSQIVNDVLLTTYPINTTEGIYQLVVPPAAFGKSVSRNVAIVMDLQGTSYSTISVASMKQYLRTSLVKDYNINVDSFNLFYVYKNKLVQAFAGWQPINTTTVMQAIDVIPFFIADDPSLYQSLLTTALQFCSTTSPGKAEVLLVSDNHSYTADQNVVNKLFDDIKTAIGGYKNKINVLSFSKYNKFVSSTNYTANKIWYNKLTLATGGVLYEYTYSYGSYLVPIPKAFSEIAYNAGESTKYFDIDLDMNNGFTYSKYIISDDNRLSFSSNYMITGKYYGDMSMGATVDLKAITSTGNINKTVSIPNPVNGSVSYVREWAYHYIEDMIGQKNNSYVQEIIDSSINNRVLCDYTAFLAVETGDTIATNVDENPSLSIKKEMLESKVALKLYPNPFSNRLTIELPAGAEKIEVYDMTGRRVFIHELLNKEASYTWNGSDNAGNELPQGVYLVVVKSDNERFSIKVMKQ